MPAGSPLVYESFLSATRTVTGFCLITYSQVVNMTSTSLQLVHEIRVCSGKTYNGGLVSQQTGISEANVA